MYYSLAQNIVVARGSDDGWINILVLVVLAVVYGLGALIKAKGNKIDDQDQEQLSRQPRRKPSSGGGGILEQIFKEIQQAAEGKPTQVTRPSSQTARRQTVRPKAALRKYAADTKQVRQIPSISAATKANLPKSSPRDQRNVGNLAELDNGIQVFPEITKKVVGLSDKRKHMPAQSDKPGYLTDFLSDHKDPDELKRAILYYEILGKPLALRDQSEGIIGL